ncbi:helix-turn-helix transcriptional regulator [Achromobacter sp. LC458]|uniref:helix-turn-helix domain-containing protein n=1 Tax=Achromobacter sp. LC458 TaxID=1120623 RepID=UPI00069926F1|nr:helix-turn-helix transcriptional regulator [Achromobacter sp. LC458]TRM52846.1 helix-turn-helix transcriptional regulator [Achromobacter sp. LC458]
MEMNIGERLREERKRLAMDQATFGAIGGVKALAQHTYESGKRSPDAKYLEAVAAAGADVLYIVTGARSLSAKDLEADLERYGMAWETLELALEATDRKMSPAKKRKAADALFRASKAQMAPTQDQLIALVLDLAA